MDEFEQALEEFGYAVQHATEQDSGSAWSKVDPARQQVLKLFRDRIDKLESVRANHDERLRECVALRDEVARLKADASSNT